MAFIECTIYNGTLSARVIYRDDGTPIIQAKCGVGYIAMDCEEAVKLRDDLSRAITEAAQQHAQTVAKARGGYDTPSGHDIGCEEFPPGAKHECSCKAAQTVAKDAQEVTL